MKTYDDRAPVERNVRFGGIMDNEIVDDLVQIVKRLAKALKKALPNNNLPDIALDYLKRKNLCGSPLRIQACREEDREMAATTAGSEMINAAIQALNTETPNASLTGGEAVPLKR